MNRVPPSKDEIMAQSRRDLLRSRKLQFGAAAIGFGMGFMSALTHDPGEPQTNVYEQIGIGTAFVSLTERRIRFSRIRNRVNGYTQRFISPDSSEEGQKVRTGGMLNTAVQAASFATSINAAEFMVGWSDYSETTNTLGGISHGIGAILLTFPLGEKMNESYLQGVQAQLDSIDAARIDTSS